MLVAEIALPAQRLGEEAARFPGVPVLDARGCRIVVADLLGLGIHGVHGRDVVFAAGVTLAETEIGVVGDAVGKRQFDESLGQQLLYAAVGRALLDNHPGILVVAAARGGDPARSVDAVFVVIRHDGQGAHHGVHHRRGPVARFQVVAHVAVERSADLDVFVDLDAEFHVHRDAVGPVVGDKYAVLLHVAYGHAVIEPFASARDAQVVLVDEGRFEADVEPVGRGVYVGVGLHALLVLLDDGVGVGDARGCFSRVDFSLVAQAHVEDRVVDRVGYVGRVLYAEVGPVVDDRCAFRTFLGGDEYDAVRGFRSVDGRRGVFQYGDRLDVGRIDFVDVVFHAVEQYQRVGAAERVDAADADRTSVRAGFGVVLVDPHARGVVHRLRGVGDGLVGLFFHVDRGNRTGEVHALDRAVAHDHDIFEDGGLFELHQPDVRCREYLGLKADVVECQFFGQCGNRHFESAVDTRRRTLERTHVDDRGAHDRVAFQVGDLSLDFQRLAGFRGSLFFREKHLFVDDAVGIGRSCEHLSEHVEDRGAAFRHRDAQPRVDQVVVVEKREFALRFDGLEHVEDRGVFHFNGQTSSFLCVKRCGHAVRCDEQDAAKQAPEVFPDCVKVFHKRFLN